MSKVKQFFKDLFTYFISVYFWKTVISVAIFVIIVVFLTNLFLKSYTRHGKEMPTPTFVGMHLFDAQKLAKEKQLRLQVIDSIYEVNMPPGTIIDQSPKPNFPIKKGRTIFVTIKAFSKKLVPLPDISKENATSFVQAQIELQQAGFKVGKVHYVPTAQFPDLVFAMLYNGDTVYPGQKLPYGAKIDLVVGKQIVDSLDIDTSAIW